MSAELQYPVPHRHATGQSRTALTFFLLAATAFGIAILLATDLAGLIGRPVVRERFWFPPAFAVSTALLVAGSVAMIKSVAAVRREKQRTFRRWLLIALGIGACFMGVQGYGLWALLPAERATGDASLGATPYVLMLAALHALHLSVAVLFLAFVLARAENDRYDHEYYWGVSICGWFWHALGIAWLFVLLILGIAAAHGVAM
jgi:cytochrome c oxidase subunit 3